MKTYKKWILGIATILAAISGYVATNFGDDDRTNDQTLSYTVQEIRSGIETIQADTATTGK